jgi:hypothetical protein
MTSRNRQKRSEARQVEKRLARKAKAGKKPKPAAAVMPAAPEKPATEPRNKPREAP